VEKNDLVIATHGRSFYVLENIGALRQFTAAVLLSKAHLFAPSPVIRSLGPAVIDYYLAAGSSNAVFEVLDSRGQLVRSFSGSDANGPSVHPGTNRFTWDLRYPGPSTFPGIVLRYADPNQGPVAPPGEYSVRLIANGLAVTQPLLIKSDPRSVNLTDAELQEQFQLALQIRDQTSRAHEAVIRIRSLNSQLAQRSAEARDPALSQAAGLISSKLDEVEGDIYQVKNRSPRDTLNYPIKLNNQLAVLQRLVDTGNARPTDQDYAVFRELTARLNEMLGRFEEIVAKDLKQFNDQLSARKLAPVTANK
jgi:hypothetical protein